MAGAPSFPQQRPEPRPRRPASQAAGAWLLPMPIGEYCPRQDPFPQSWCGPQSSEVRGPIFANTCEETLTIYQKLP